MKLEDFVRVFEEELANMLEEDRGYIDEKERWNCSSLIRDLRDESPILRAQDSPREVERPRKGEDLEDYLIRELPTLLLHPHSSAMMYRTVIKGEPTTRKEARRYAKAYLMGYFMGRDKN